MSCRDAILDALSPLAVGTNSGIAGGEGAIYFWAKLPQGTSHPPHILLLLVFHRYQHYNRTCYYRGRLASDWSDDSLLL